MGQLTHKIKKKYPDIADPTPEEVEEFVTRVVKQISATPTLTSAGIGVRMLDQRIDEGMIPRGAKSWVTRARNGGSMILAGPTGAGKTIAAVWCLHRAFYLYGSIHVDTNSRLTYDAPSMRFLKSHDFTRAVFDKSWDSINQWRTVDLLVVDDWGADYGTEWPLREFDNMIDRRWENRLPTIVTTNRHPTKGDDSMTKIVPRAVSRLCDDPGPGAVMMDRKDQRAK